MMKKFKVIAALSLVLVFLASCSTSKEARTFKKSIDMSKLLFFDLETTGVKFWRNGIHQIGGIVDIDGQEAERFDIRLVLNSVVMIEQEALDVAGVTLD